MVYSGLQVIVFLNRLNNVLTLSLHTVAPSSPSNATTTFPMTYHVLPCPCRLRVAKRTTAPRMGEECAARFAAAINSLWDRNSCAEHTPPAVAPAATMAIQVVGVVVRNLRARGGGGGGGGGREGKRGKRGCSVRRQFHLDYTSEVHSKQLQRYFNCEQWGVCDVHEYRQNVLSCTALHCTALRCSYIELVVHNNCFACLSPIDRRGYICA